MKEGIVGKLASTLFSLPEPFFIFIVRDAGMSSKLHNLRRKRRKMGGGVVDGDGLQCVLDIFRF